MCEDEKTEDEYISPEDEYELIQSYEDLYGDIN